MRTIKYKHFEVECRLEDPVTVDNYFRHDIIINNAKGAFVCRIHASELWLGMAEGLLSGDEKMAQDALDWVISNREYDLDRLRKFHSGEYKSLRDYIL